jgi:4'-phosphopantetheinyl transferase
MIKLYYLEVDLLDKEKINNLSKYRLDKASKFIFDKDKKLSLGAGLLLNQGLNDLYNLKENEVEIKLTKYGKPYIYNHSEINFNISHTSKMSICVFSSSNVGCDIEQIRELDQGIINKCYSPKEKEYIEKCKNKDKAFTRIWIHKEAFLKCLGLGLNDQMNQFTINIDSNNITINQNITNKEYIFEERKINNYLISICYEKGE